MNYYAGIDVSLEESCICVIDANGKVVREGKVLSEPTALIAWLSEAGVTVTRIGLEAGPLSQWLYAAMRQAGLAVELSETRHVRNAFRFAARQGLTIPGPLQKPMFPGNMASPRLASVSSKQPDVAWDTKNSRDSSDSESSCSFRCDVRHDAAAEVVMLLPEKSVTVTASDFALASGSWRALTKARRFQISLRSRYTAMLAGLRTLIQTRQGPDR
jgi:hypothetical protein